MTLEFSNDQENSVRYIIKWEKQDARNMLPFIWKCICVDVYTHICIYDILEENKRNINSPEVIKKSLFLSFLIVREFYILEVLIIIENSTD